MYRCELFQPESKIEMLSTPDVFQLSEFLIAFETFPVIIVSDYISKYSVSSSVNHFAFLLCVSEFHYIQNIKVIYTRSTFN